MLSGSPSLAVRSKLKSKLSIKRQVQSKLITKVHSSYNTTICILHSSHSHPPSVKSYKARFSIDYICGCMSVADWNHMRKEGSKQSKIKHCILAPLRVLNKARQIYMKSVVECAGGYGYDGGVGALSPAVHLIPQLPNTNSANLNSWRTSGDEGEGEPVPIKNVENETGLVVHRQRQPFVGYKYNRNKMSYSTEVRKIGRIDKEQPCYFEEDQINVKTHLLYLYPRRRSNIVVNKRAVYC